MTKLELLAPARNMEIGIAAIDCGADAVYIAGPAFGARQAAGNSIGDIRSLCSYAHRFGAKIFVTLNTILYDEELEAAYRQMLEVQEAGADALIVQDFAVLQMAAEGIGNLREDFKIPLHASTQCAIRTPEQARFLYNLGFSRLILEREMSLEQIQAIHKSVDCELEFFVHGALCVCYSGQCYLSQMIDGRSANRGACMQACRSRYDLVDGNGKVLRKDSALLSLKDYNLLDRVGDLARCGVQSFKIEGRLKNISYVRNVVRAYSQALDRFVAEHPDQWCRASAGSVDCDFTPDLNKTFNRGYTSLFIDGKRGNWASEGSAKSMGEAIGKVKALNRNRTEIQLASTLPGLKLNNGDGFTYTGKDGKVYGFRGDVCNGLNIRCKDAGPITVGTRLFRNMDTAFEKELEKSTVRREIRVKTRLVLDQDAEGQFMVRTTSQSEDGRKFAMDFEAGNDIAQNEERILSMLQSQISKSAEEFRFEVTALEHPGPVPFLTAAFMNNIRRSIAEGLSSLPVTSNALTNRNAFLLQGLRQLKAQPSPMSSTSDKGQPSAEPAATDKGQEALQSPGLYVKASYKQNIANHLAEAIYKASGAVETAPAYELEQDKDAELMRTKYCIRYELGLCPVHQGAKPTGPLFLMNNGRRLALVFDCKNCEMVVKKA